MDVASVLVTYIPLAPTVAMLVSAVVSVTIIPPPVVPVIVIPIALPVDKEFPVMVWAFSVSAEEVIVKESCVAAEVTVSPPVIATSFAALLSVVRAIDVTAAEPTVIARAPAVPMLIFWATASVPIPIVLAESMVTAPVGSMSTPLVPATVKAPSSVLIVT